MLPAAEAAAAAGGGVQRSLGLFWLPLTVPEGNN